LTRTFTFSPSGSENLEHVLGLSQRPVGLLSVALTQTVEDEHIEGSKTAGELRLMRAIERRRQLNNNLHRTADLAGPADDIAGIQMTARGSDGIDRSAV